MRIALFGKRYQLNGYSYLQQLLDKLIASNCTVLIYAPFYDAVREHITLFDACKLYHSREELAGQADLLLSVGGDGTLLDTLMLVGDSGLPVLGINLGRLGFLSSIRRDDIERAIGDVLHNNYRIEPRTLLSVKGDRPMFDTLNYALNELTIRKAVGPSMVLLHVYIDGYFLNSYWADGLIVSTPTGSTGYSMSCGGPIVAPNSCNFVITPIATHNLTVRPIVIPDNSVIKIRVEGRDDSFQIGLDSRSEDIFPGETVEVFRAPFIFNLVQLNDENFYRTIREKLMWGQDIRM